MTDLEDAFQELYAAIITHQRQVESMYEMIGRVVVMQSEDPKGSYLEETTEVMQETRQAAEWTKNAVDTARLVYENAVIKYVDHERTKCPKQAAAQRLS
jgi:hypothetical protein